MLSDKTLHKLKELAEEVCQRESCRLYDLEFAGGSQGRVLRIFVTGIKKDVSLEQCADISRGLSWLLDTHENLIPGDSYKLEVSSPGLERILKEKWHFEEAINESVKLSLHQPLTTLPEELPEPFDSKGFVGIDTFVALLLRC